MDGTIPRARLPEVLMSDWHLMSKKYKLRVANVFHAGDGNLHPLIMYDANKLGELDRAEEFGTEILKLCVEVGGVLTGEHGVGVEKRDLMEKCYVYQRRIEINNNALNVLLIQNGLLNPGKVFPTLHRCAELGRVHIHHAAKPLFLISRDFRGEFSVNKSLIPQTKKEVLDIIRMRQ